jgi:hypothetical protein
MKSVIALVLAISLVAGLSLGCAGQKPPVVSPQIGQSLTNGLAALSHLLAARPDVPPAVIVAIANAQAALAADISGASYGQIVRQLLVNLYSQLSNEVLTQYWYVFAALEVALAAIGA